MTRLPQVLINVKGVDKAKVKVTRWFRRLSPPQRRAWVNTVGSSCAPQAPNQSLE